MLHTGAYKQWLNPCKAQIPQQQVRALYQVNAGMPVPCGKEDAAVEHTQPLKDSCTKHFKNISASGPFGQQPVSQPAEAVDNIDGALLAGNPGSHHIVWLKINYNEQEQVCYLQQATGNNRSSTVFQYPVNTDLYSMQVKNGSHPIFVSYC